jgi:GNAT superfamily N-acetyltransferase
VAKKAKDASPNDPGSQGAAPRSETGKHPRPDENPDVEITSTKKKDRLTAATPPPEPEVEEPTDLAPDDPEGLFPDEPEPTHGLRDVANRTIQALLAFTSRDDSAPAVVESADHDLDSGPVTTEIPIVSLPTTAGGTAPRIRSGKRRSVGLIAKVDDQPGSLGLLFARLGENAVDLRTVFGIPGEGNASRLELVVSTPVSLSDADLVELLRDLCTDVRVRPWGSPTVEDMISAILDLSTAVVSHPEVLDDMLVTLLGAQGAEHTAPLVGADDSRGVMRVQLSPDDHLVLSRPWAPFEPVDRQRASALLRLAAAAQRARGDDTAGRLVRIKNGERLWYRLARPEDADRLASMHERSSATSLYLRYHGAAELGDLALRRLAGGHRGATIVAMNRDGLLVAAGHVFPIDEQTCEIAMLVEDDYQAKGVGAELLAELLELAVELGFAQVRADVIGDNYPMLMLLERTGLKWHKKIENGVVAHEARLDGRPMGRRDS